jgi:hypothetical protein
MEDNEMIVKHHVPILDEHELKDGKGNVVIRLDQKKLSEIVRVNNKRMGSTGDEIPLVIGHTKDDASEDDQPEIVGYATNLKVEPFFKTGRKCITATFKFFKHAADKVRGFPRRSIELWLSDYKIDPISLLGATTPERDLGLLRLSKGGVKKYQRTIGMNDQQGIIEGVLAGLQQTDVWQFLTQLSQQGGAEGAPEEGGMPPEGMPGEQPPMPEQGMEDPSMGGEQPPMPEEGGEEPMPEESTEEEEPIRQSRSGKYDRIKLSRVEQENQLLQKEIRTIKIKFQRAEREKDLIELEAEGYMLDRGEELALVQSLPETTYRSHLQIIRKRYQRAPLGARSSYYQESRSGGPRGRTKDEVASAIEYATANGISYQEALGKMNAEKVL